MINCRKCHAAKCFSHILQAQVHSSEALLANAADSNSNLWHQFHQTARQRDPVSSDDPMMLLNNAERLVFCAIKFPNGLALGSSTSAGFYDVSTPVSSSEIMRIFQVISSDQVTVELGSIHNTVGNHGSSVVPPVASGSRAAATNAPADTEPSRTSSNQTLNVHSQTAESDNVNLSASQSASKRGRSPDSEDSESTPNKRPRLLRNSTRTLRYVRPTLMVFSESCLYRAFV